MNIVICTLLIFILLILSDIKDRLIQNEDLIKKNNQLLKQLLQQNKILK